MVVLYSIERRINTSTTVQNMAMLDTASLLGTINYGQFWLEEIRSNANALSYCNCTPLCTEQYLIVMVTKKESNVP